LWACLLVRGGVPEVPERKVAWMRARDRDIIRHTARVAGQVCAQLLL
jgi:hypothetical protein